MKWNQVKSNAAQPMQTENESLSPLQIKVSLIHVDGIM